MKYYFQEHDGDCYTLDYHLDCMKENDIKEMEVFEGIIARGIGYFFCQADHEMGEVGYCGKMCEDYQPRNGKSGICKHHNFPRYPGKSKILKLK